MSDLKDEARDALLESIKQAATSNHNPPQLLQLAEAWAFLVQPGASRGGGSGGSKAKLLN